MDYKYDQKAQESQPHPTALKGYWPCFLLPIFYTLHFSHFFKLLYFHFCCLCCLLKYRTSNCHHVLKTINIISVLKEIS